MPFYTIIPTQTPIKRVYPLGDLKTQIIPGPKVCYKSNQEFEYYLDSVRFYTESYNKHEHQQLLKQWVIAHSFLTNDGFPIELFHSGKLGNHIEVAAIDPYTPEFEHQEGAIDLEEMGNLIYFPHSVLEKISYNSLFKKIDSELRDFLVLYLDFLSDNSFHPIDPSFRIFNRHYLKIVTYATLLEQIFDNKKSYCPEEIICPKCQKKVPRHRNESERKWRHKQLEIIIGQQEIVDQYLKIIDFAIEIRHKSVHTGQISKAERLLLNTGFEEYGYQKAIGIYKNDENALQSLIINLSEVTRNLILYKYFGLKNFFKLKPLFVNTVTS